MEVERLPTKNLTRRASKREKYMALIFILKCDHFSGMETKQTLERKDWTCAMRIYHFAGPNSPMGRFYTFDALGTLLKQKWFRATHVNRRWRYQIVFLSVFTRIQMICPKSWSKSLPKIAKSPLPVDLRRLKTSLRKLCIPSARTWANSWLRLPWTFNTIITGLNATVFVKFYAFLTGYLFQNRISLITDKNCGK